MTMITLKKETAEKMAEKFTIPDLHFIALISDGISPSSFDALIDQLAFDGVILNTGLPMT